MFTTRTLKLASLVALAGIVASALGDDERALRYMARYLRGEYNTNIVAVLRQNSEDKGTTTLKVQRSKDGKYRQSVLYPLHLQFEYVDDGKKVKQYLPDDRTMFVQPSVPSSQEASFRLPLLQKNYTLKSETGKRIAGRRSVVVTATSRYNQVPYIRYSFDEATGFLLGMDTILPGGEVVNGFEVTDVKFPSKLDDSVFKLDPVAGVEVINYSEQKGLAKLSDATPKLGFTPIVPSDIPFGFQIQKISVSVEGECRMLCLKLTDGIHSAKVYEWRYVPGEKIKTGEASLSQVCRGLKITVVCDLGTDLRESFLRPFLARLDRESPAMLTSIGF